MAFSDYLRNKLHDYLHRGQTFTPAGTLYLALCSSAPTASTAGIELAGSGYARQPIVLSLSNVSGTQGAGSTAVSSGTTGQVSNNAAINFGTAGSNWGTMNNWELYDAATGGNRYEFGTLRDSFGNPTTRVISSGEPVFVPISSFILELL
jgi:hypothetical protein